MESLQNTKQRIKLVSSIKKITHAMEMISIAKIRRTKNIFNNISPYSEEMNLTFNKIISKLDRIDFENIFSANNATANLYIIITSDLGMAGSYNSNIFKLSRSLLEENDKIIVLGHKGNSFFNDKKWDSQIIDSYPFPNEDIDYHIIKKITKEILDMYKNNEIGKIKILYTDFVNNLVQKEVEKTIFPIEYTPDKSEKNFEFIEIEPSPYEVLKNAFPLYVSNYIYTCCIVSKLSENAARRMAMENATNNAKDIILQLKKDFNRKRQAIITQELNEIIAGADAI
ncbi:ATP synthase F1 subunit gamma [Mycoplasmopsis lipophila]|uniref:ATP synthase F1 subunit gamma n=1 Tax=Mycoplasmopsis lipophila TaxID=2117 RepID=UPI003873C2F1